MNFVVSRRLVSEPDIFDHLAQLQSQGRLAPRALHSKPKTKPFRFPRHIARHVVEYSQIVKEYSQVKEYSFSIHECYAFSIREWYSFSIHEWIPTSHPDHPDQQRDPVFSEYQPGGDPYWRRCQHVRIHGRPQPYPLHPRVPAVVDDPLAPPPQNCVGNVERRRPGHGF